MWKMWTFSGMGMKVITFTSLVVKVEKISKLRTSQVKSRNRNTAEIMKDVSIQEIAQSLLT